jgi:hypothetical protein
LRRSALEPDKLGEWWLWPTTAALDQARNGSVWIREEAAMATDKELEQYAHDCIRLAGMTDDPAIREPLLKMAREWMEVAVPSNSKSHWASSREAEI